jgi:hypothetical protein
MPFTRVQATGKVIADSTLSVAATFASPPTVGNAIVVPAVLWGGPAPACADNRGNTYSLAIGQVNVSPRVAIFYCAQIATSAAPFTITLSSSPSNYWVVCAVEIGGLGGGPLLLDQTTSATGGSATPSTGATAALTANGDLLVAVYSVSGSEASITVESVSPAWTQEAEELSFAHAVGESDTRILTAGLGASASCTWTVPVSTGFAAAIAAFKASAVETAQPFVILPC